MLILTISLLTRNIRLILKLAIPTSALTVVNEKRETSLLARPAKRKTSKVLLAKSSAVIHLFSV